jgi:pimeloyl-ACP methyl ester carboxylesterase
LRCGNTPAGSRHRPATHRPFHRGPRPAPLHPGHAGLRRPGGIPARNRPPGRLDALIVQNAVAHEDGLGPLWQTRRDFWADRKAHEAALRQNFFCFAATRQRHVGTSPNAENYDPDLWTDEFAFLSRPGQQDIQTELFYDYRTNVASYTAWQDWLRQHQPPLLVLWGRYDPSFQVQEAEAYRRDVPDAEVHILDAGHFALDEQPDAIADLTRGFLDRRGPAGGDAGPSRAP